MTTAQHTLADNWLKAGIREGDLILVHSSIRRTLARFKKQYETITPVDVLESLLAVLGTSGTLLLPLFNFDFTRGVPFNISTTPSQMGALTETGRIHTRSVRTGHPIYSFTVIGHRAEAFRNVNNFSGYGHDSPFAMLREMGGKIAVLDLDDQRSMTFYHHVEEMCGAPYRYHKRFTGEYTDASGNTEQRTYGMFVRDIESGVVTHVNPAGELMWETGLYTGYRPGQGCGMRIVSARAMYDFVANIIDLRKAEGLLYRIGGRENG